MRVVLNKADSIDTQALMRVYGALMWSLGKVKQTPEVTRVYISSFWEKPFKNTENEKLFTSEREDLFKELRDLPRYSAIRKINDLVKRARYIKVHALVIGHLKSKMPSFMSKASTQKKLLDTMDEVFRAVQREHQLPFGDFPNMEEFKEQIGEMDFSKFPKLDLRQIEQMDEILGKDVPALMAQFPAERVDQTEALRSQYAAEMGDSGAVPPARPPAPANPFASMAGGGTGADTTTWLITPQDQVRNCVRKRFCCWMPPFGGLCNRCPASAWRGMGGILLTPSWRVRQAKYRSIFQSCGPVDGLVGGEQAKVRFA